MHWDCVIISKHFFISFLNLESLSNFEFLIQWSYGRKGGILEGRISIYYTCKSAPRGAGEPGRRISQFGKKNMESLLINICTNCLKQKLYLSAKSKSRSRESFRPAGKIPIDFSAENGRMGKRVSALLTSL